MAPVEDPVGVSPVEGFLVEGFPVEPLPTRGYLKYAGSFLLLTKQVETLSVPGLSASSGSPTSLDSRVLLLAVVEQVP